jgi:hypothetical protein
MSKIEHPVETVWYFFRIIFSYSEEPAKIPRD